jgi:hypothetical protein
LAHPVRKWQAVPLPSGAVNVWALLTDALASAGERPENSVTPNELAQRMGVTPSRAAYILRNRADLRAVHYHVNGRRAVCYVPAEGA